MPPMTSLHFAVQLGDLAMNCSEVSGLVVEAEVIEYRGGADLAAHVTKQPGLRKAGNVTFKRGILGTKEGNALYAWYDTVQTKDFEPRDVTVSLRNETFDPVMTWTLQQAWPAKLEGPGLNATGNEIAIETLELAVEKISVQAS